MLRTKPLRRRPYLERLETRLTPSASAGAIAAAPGPRALGRRHADVGTRTPDASPSPTTAGDVTGDGRVNSDDLQIFAAGYGSRVGKPGFNAAADFNSDGAVDAADARVILNGLAPSTPRIPLNVSVRLAPADQARYKTPSISGAATFLRVVTIVGRTTPDSLVIEDNHTSRLPGGTQAYKFPGPAHAADADGYFTFQATNREGLNNNDFLILDPFGNRVIRDFPIYWIPYATGKGVPSPRFG